MECQVAAKASALFKARKYFPACEVLLKLNFTGWTAVSLPGKK